MIHFHVLTSNKSKEKQKSYQNRDITPIDADTRIFIGTKTKTQKTDPIKTSALIPQLNAYSMCYLMWLKF